MYIMAKNILNFTFFKTFLQYSSRFEMYRMIFLDIYISIVWIYIFHNDRKYFFIVLLLLYIIYVHEDKQIHDKFIG